MKKVKNMRRPCHLYGSTNTMDGKVRQVNRQFDGYNKDLKEEALKILALRKDEGSPWYGDAVYVVTPEKQKIVVDVPWPEVK